MKSMAEALWGPSVTSRPEERSTASYEAPIGGSQTGHEHLQIELLGMQLTNPVLVASGPLSDSEPQIRRLFQEGAGAVVTKTIYAGALPTLQERTIRLPVGTLNSTTYSRRSLEHWQRTLSNIVHSGLPVIASIHADSPAALTRLALAVSETGCRAIELGICCPNDGSQQQASAPFVAAYTTAARHAVALPIAVKLAAVDGLLEGARAAISAGADAISLSDTLPALSIDIESGLPRLCEPIGYSGSGIKPLVLYAIRRLRQSGIGCPILGIGGISSAADVIEYLHAGANATQIYTALMVHGTGLLSRITRDLSSFCAHHQRTIRQLHGGA